MARQRGRPPKPKPEDGSPSDEEIYDDGTGDRSAVAISVKELVDQREAMAEEITKTLSLCSEQLSKILELDLKIYTSLSGPDALFSDCPISPAFTKEWARQQLYAAGLKFGEDIWEGEISVLPFSERIKSATPWVMRFAKDPIKKKTGIEAILEEKA